MRRARPRARKYEVSCASLRGFVLRVLPSGKKVYYVRHRKRGRDTRERVGLVTELSLAQAQARAAALLRGAAPPDAPPAPSPTSPSYSPSPPSPPSPPSSPASPRLREFAARFDREHITPYLKPRTQKQYRDCLRLYLLPQLGELPLHTITRAHVAAVHREHRAIPCAANQAVRVLSVIFSRAIEWGVLSERAFNPAHRLRKYRERRRERFLTPDERQRLERALQVGLETRAGRPGAIGWANAAAVRLLAWTGMRRGEVLALRWEMVDYRHGCLRLPDSKTGRKTVPISRQVVALLRALEERRRLGCPWVLYSTTGQPLHPNSLERAWRRIRARAGLEGVRLHDLRHSAASDALMSGVPLDVVGKVLGHRSPRTTARYAHIADHVVAEAVARMGDAIERAQTGTGD
ncbi:MAG: site-specific integrase [Myxococcales bacterium]|nr:site-specific integrase [Myxococcales bacterium]